MRNSLHILLDSIAAQGYNKHESETNFTFYQLERKRRSQEEICHWFLRPSTRRLKSFALRQTKKLKNTWKALDLQRAEKLLLLPAVPAALFAK